MYPVYELDTYFSDWGMHNVLVGAESKEDLRNHITYEVLGLTKSQFNKLWRESWRVKKIDGLYTDKPYVVLSSYWYSE